MTHLSIVWLAAVCAGAPAAPESVGLVRADLYAALRQAAGTLGEFEYIAVAADDRTMDATLDGDREAVLNGLAKRYGCEHFALGPIHCFMPDEVAEVPLAGMVDEMRRCLPEGAAEWAIEDLPPEQWAGEMWRHTGAAQDRVVELASARWAELAARRPAPVASAGASVIVLLELDPTLRNALVELVVCQTTASALSSLARSALRAGAGNPALGTLRLQSDELVTATNSGDYRLSGRIAKDDVLPDPLLGWRPRGASLGRHDSPVLAQRLDLDGIATLSEWAEQVAAQARVAIHPAADAADKTLAMHLEQRPLWLVLNALSLATGRLWASNAESQQYALEPVRSAGARLYADLTSRQRASALLGRCSGTGVGGAPLVWHQLTAEQRAALRAGGILQPPALSPGCRDAIEIAVPSLAISQVMGDLEHARACSLDDRLRVFYCLVGDETSFAWYQGGGRTSAVRLEAADTDPSFAGLRYGGPGRLRIRAATFGSFGDRSGAPARTQAGRAEAPQID